MFDDRGVALERGSGCFFQLRVGLWSPDIGADPWRKAVQPPDNPSGSDIWWLRIPVKIGDGTQKLVSDAATVCCYTTSGLLPYSGTAFRDLYVSRDGYPYVSIGTKTTFGNSVSATVSLDTTVFVSRRASVTG